MKAAQETLERATKWAEFAIEATLGRREDYPAAFARLRVVISAAIEEEREACAKIPEAAITEVPAHNSQTILYRDYIKHNNAMCEQLAEEIRTRNNSLK